MRGVWKSKLFSEGFILHDSIAKLTAFVNRMKLEKGEFIFSVVEPSTKGYGSQSVVLVYLSKPQMKTKKGKK